MHRSHYTRFLHFQYHTFFLYRKEAIDKDLADIEPLLMEARSAVSEIRNEALAEIRSLRAPPEVIRDILVINTDSYCAVMLLNFGFPKTNPILTSIRLFLITPISLLLVFQKK